jgi:hypothetical protein
MWDVKDEKYANASDVLKKYGLVPLEYAKFLNYLV